MYIPARYGTHGIPPWIRVDVYQLSNLLQGLIKFHNHLPVNYECEYMQEITNLNWKLSYHRDAICKYDAAKAG